MRANKKNKEAAKAFVASLKANGGTFTMNAVKAAMQIKGADSIVVLSDGMPNDVDLKSGSQLDTKKILDEIAAINRLRRVIIDTFGFDAAAGGNKGRALPGGFGRSGGRRGGGGAVAGEQAEEDESQHRGNPRAVRPQRGAPRRSWA